MNFKSINFGITFILIYGVSELCSVFAQNDDSLGNFNELNCGEKVEL